MNGNNLKSLLAGLDLTQVQLAKLVDRDPVTVNRWCTDVVPVPAHVLRFLMAYQMLTPRRRLALRNDAGIE